jgi:ParB family chromosome partitioning protein
MKTHSETVLLPVSSIAFGERLRSVDGDYVQMLMASIGDLGLLQPIEVSKPDKKGVHTLIAGAHRLTALQQLGVEEVPAIIVSASKLEMSLREIDENLMRRELTPLDRATFLAKRKEVYEALHPATKHGGDRDPRQVAKFGDLVERFTSDVAAKLDLSERSVQRAISRFMKIAPDVRAKIATTWIARKGAMLDAIAKQEPAIQRAIVGHLLAEVDAPKTVAAALERVSGTKRVERSDEDAEFQAMMKAYRNAGQRARDRFIAFLDTQTVEDGDQIDEAA